MFGIADDSVFRDFEEIELQNPCARNLSKINVRTIYTSRHLRMPNKLDSPILCDFGSAVLGDEEHSDDIQPDIYRAPEVILQAPWTYSVERCCNGSPKSENLPNNLTRMHGFKRNYISSTLSRVAYRSKGLFVIILVESICSNDAFNH